MINVLFGLLDYGLVRTYGAKQNGITFSNLGIPQERIE